MTKTPHPFKKTNVVTAFLCKLQVWIEQTLRRALSDCSPQPLWIKDMR